MTARPQEVKDEHLRYLDGLRESGAVNMGLAPQLLRDEFPDLDKAASRVVGMYWMRTFGKASR